MHKKKRKIFSRLHSIPIKVRSLCTQKNFRSKCLSHLSERLYLVSYSIPLGCMVALLLVGMISLITVSSYNSVYAEDENINSSNSQRAVTREVLPSTVSLNITGDRNAEVETGTGVTAYRSHAVNVTVSDVQEYYLRISGSTELTPPTGGTAIPGVGTAGVKGSEMPENSWGYAWTSNGSAVDSEDDMTYVSMPDTATSLAIPNLVDGNASFSGKLSFGAKFAATSVLGNYTSGVQLTLIATPKSNTGSNHGFWYNENGAPTGLDSGTATMQDAAPNFCRGNSQVGVGWTVQLEDNRDGKTYTIVKLKDGNCWMQENLALEADPEKYPDGMTLAPGDTDLPGDTTWVLPKSVTSWNTSDNTVAQVATGEGATVSSQYPGDGRGWQQGYGNYYSWIAATAGTGSSVTSDGGVASGSICPKGWKLPTGGSNTNAYNQFRNLFGTDGNDLGNDWQAKFDTVQQAPYLFGAAGLYLSDGLRLPGTGGYYWSRTSNSSTDAYRLSFDSTSFYPGTNNVNRYTGFSVRCVQENSGNWFNGTNTDDLLDIGIRNMQDITKNNFTTKYCANNTTANSLVPIGSTIRLLDSRDGRNYTIVKLADGNCWMQENLALSGSRTLTNSDSDIVASSWILPADVGSWNTSNNNLAQVKTGNTSLSGWQEGWGNYYSWQAATAGTGSSAITDGTNAASSICPKGWKLPTGTKTGANTVNQFETLFGTDGANLGSDWQAKFDNVQKAPYNFPAAGYVRQSSGVLDGAGTGGRYWSRTSYSSTNTYGLGFDSGSFIPGTSNGYVRYFGFSVRCVAEPAS